MVDKKQARDFRELKFNFSKCYVGEKFKWLRFCLYDILPKGKLKESKIGSFLLNELESMGEISPTNIKELSDIANLTNVSDAKKLVDAYNKNNKVVNESENEILNTHRRGLLKMLKEVGPNELQTVVGNYDTLAENYVSIWDVVFELEQQMRLTAEEDDIEEFLRCLNETTQKVYRDELTRAANADSTSFTTSGSQLATKPVLAEADRISEASNKSKSASSTKSTMHTAKAVSHQEWPKRTAEEVLQMKMEIGHYADVATDGNSKIYRMTSKPRGKALIINNESFVELKIRTGTDRDSNILESLFEELEFEVDKRKDVQYEEFHNLLQTYSEMDHALFDCFILVVLSHGENGAVFTTDDKLLKIEDIQGYFTGDRCPTLNSKPKLFFIQACRGKQRDRGVETDDGTLNLEDDEMDNEDEFQRACGKLPRNCDIFTAYSTIPGYVSYRDTVRGSWFVQALAETFKEEACNEDLGSMATMVNDKIASAFEVNTYRGNFKQMSESVSKLRKKLFFFPGH